MKDFVSTAQRLSLEADWAESRVTEIRSAIGPAFSDAASHVGTAFASRVANAVIGLMAERGLTRET